MLEEKPGKKTTCPIDDGLNAIGGKWKPRVVCALSQGPMRVRALQSHITEIAPGTLASTLKKLHLDGLLNREVFPEKPPRVEYSLTEKGREAESILHQICEWRRKHIGAREPAFAPGCVVCHRS